MTDKPKGETLAVIAGVKADKAHNAVMPPLYLSSNFSFPEPGAEPEFDYTRSGNPTRLLLAQALADLEDGVGGVITSSGMAAVDLVLTLAGPGDLVVAPKDCYGGTYRLLEARRKKGGFEVAFVNQSDRRELEAVLARKPRLVLVETPTNPLMRIVDIAPLCRRAKEVGALVAVDNTFLSPARQQPIALGADLVIHSTTKYINGHSDVVGGAVIAASEDLQEHLTWWANCTGVTGAPFDAYMTLRGLKTLYARLSQQEKSAGEIARFLDAAPGIERVYFPGLKTHPGHEIAARQQSGFGAMLSFELAGGLQSVKAFTSRLSLFTLAESLGGVESLIAHPTSMTHAAMDPEARKEAGIGEGLLRLSVGIECVDDLLADLQRGLDALQIGTESGAEGEREQVNLQAVGR